MGVTAFRGESQEDRLGDGDRLRAAAHHEAVAVLEPPDPTGGAGVDEQDAVLGEPGGIRSGIFVVRVAPVYHHVAGLEVLGEGVHGLFGRLARGHHHPGHPGRGKLPGHLFEACGRVRPVGRHRRSRFGPEVEADHLVTLLDQSPGHVGAHLAQPDHPDLHRGAPPSELCGPRPPLWQLSDLVQVVQLHTNDTTTVSEQAVVVADRLRADQGSRSHKTHWVSQVLPDGVALARAAPR